MLEIVQSSFRLARKQALRALVNKQVRICGGVCVDPERRVKVGYVIESPIWKTSYRLVLDKDGKPYLQGWAIVENTTDEDWNSVKMALVSSLRGYPPQVAVEFARKLLFSGVRPTFADLEVELKGKK